MTCAKLDLCHLMRAMLQVLRLFRWVLPSASMAALGAAPPGAERTMWHVNWKTKNQTFDFEDSISDTRFRLAQV